MGIIVRLYIDTETPNNCKLKDLIISRLKELNSDLTNIFSSAMDENNELKQLELFGLDFMYEESKRALKQEDFDSLIYD